MDANFAAGTTARKQCDVIMKGGITSGIVYPEAILQLHDDYDFRNIGGASAGAIAAAATAAAQYGETKDGDKKRGLGFDGLKELNEDLKKPGKLLQLFEPTPAARALLEIFVAALRGAHRARGAWSVLLGAAYALWAVIVHLPVALIAGGAAGFWIFSAFVCLVGGSLSAAPLLCIAAAIAGAVGGALVQMAGIVLGVLPKQGFGICRLHAPESADRSVALPLTDWLFEQLDKLAGVSGPLTFGQLSKANLRLELISTNLSEMRPYSVPFDGHRLLYKIDELAGYFPQYVMNHLCRTSYPGSSTNPPAGYLFLPKAEDLPVGVGARMSLSFPVLISAVPLYTIRTSAFQRRVESQVLQLSEEDLKLNWFSDGGICSNFPIHFFDTWLPQRPTFGITLTKMPEDCANTLSRPLEGIGSGARFEAPGAPVHLPKANRVEPAAWREVTGLGEFFGSIFDTMMNYRDTLQSEQPGFRERIVQIRLTPDEGGLNLDMNPTRLDALAKKGKEAGQLLRGFDFNQHRWVRLQVLMPALAEQLIQLNRVSQGGWPNATTPYPRDARWTQVATTVLDTLANLADVNSTEPDPLRPLRLSNPKPPSTLRVVPKI